VSLRASASASVCQCECLVSVRGSVGQWLLLEATVAVGSDQN